MTRAKHKIWWDEENKIGRIQIEDSMLDEKTSNEFFDKLENINSNIPGKTKWLVDPENNIPSSKCIKMIGQRFYGNPKNRK